MLDFDGKDMTMTRSQYKGKYLSGRVTENLTLCRIQEIFLKKKYVKALEQSIYTQLSFVK